MASKNVKSRTARNWLNQLGFKYSDIKKDVYIDGHERPDVVEYRMKFITEMGNLGPYLVEFEADGSIKNKIYPAGCQVNEGNCRPINVIAHDECTFSANDGLLRAWKDPNRSFLRSKSKGQGIMVSELLLPFGRLNLSSIEKKKSRNFELRI
ncbi:hypothetical protein K3495_g12958 [Podosphaera aphanis]|nr:hypothetical protein K3495_g12958 [Podosphaera aphanis]